MTMGLSLNRSQAQRRTHGAIAIEFALVVMFVIPLVLGVVEFGRSLYAYDILAKSVRSAARHLAVGENDQSLAEGVTRHREARCIVLTGSPALSGTACALSIQLPLLTDDMITILVPSANGAVNDIVTGSGTMDIVTVSVAGYPLSQIAAIVYPDLSFGPISASVPYVFF